MNKLTAPVIILITGIALFTVALVTTVLVVLTPSPASTVPTTQPVARGLGGNRPQITKTFTAAGYTSQAALTSLGQPRTILLSADQTIKIELTGEDYNLTRGILTARFSTNNGIDIADAIGTFTNQVTPAWEPSGWLSDSFNALENGGKKKLETNLFRAEMSIIGSNFMLDITAK